MKAMKPGLGQRVREALRIIWAISAKDIVDAIKNRTTLSVLLTTLFVVVVYRFLPLLTGDHDLTNLLVYDADNSRLVAALEESLYLQVYEYPSLHRMEHALRSGDVPELGLVIPVGVDAALAAGQPVELAGYTLHWVSQEDAGALRTLVEGEIHDLTGQTVHISLEGNRAYPGADSTGSAFLTAFALIYVTTIVGMTLVPHLMIEEKENKTMAALLVSPAGAGQIVLGKALTGLFYTLLSVGVVFALNAAFIVNWPLALLATLCGAALGVALGLLLGSTIEVKQQVSLWAWLLILPLLIPVFLSMMESILPQAAVSVIRWVPTVALSRVFRVSFSDSAPLAQFGPELALVAGCALLVGAAVVWAVRRSDR
ncbi:MAG: ABC transporter permease [Anaerolineae bacterium]|nr:ABC transporter permease [Anaerolineae bacterium]